ncbi:hypothetical protein KVR01_007849 [Diaporthe batatas]|uniref:uncharacterized protein n=1 Tax=Diaporthe batatas TaxID=748121 RepID=UPI001D03CAC2|nr:uncharacterized protein KVR01_007849 [Diaporthe batatas]KAG8162084.1 hypothetical protein KVR01_007849 [Diaporthe batatas]
MAPIHFGCLVFEYQPIDVLGITDLVSSADKKYLQQISALSHISEETVARAPEIVVHHIGATLDPVRLATSSLTIVPTTTADECPELDYLLLGGPDPSTLNLHPKLADFIRNHVAAGKTLFTNCTGAAVAAMTGVLDGRKATINNLGYEPMKMMYPKVEWTIEKKWVVDGNIWTAGGAVSGMDMLAHWLKENFGLDVLICAAAMLDFEPRDIDGVQNVIPKRYDESGKQVFTHAFP